MGAFTKVERDYWQDSFVLDLKPEEKYFYLYLITNSRANALGCYELSLKVAAFETGYNADTILKYIDEFQKAKKIDFDNITHEVLIRNWGKHNWTKKTGTIHTIKKDLKCVKSPKFKERLVKMLISTGILEGSDEPIIEEQEETSGNNKEQEETTGETLSVEREVEREREIKDMVIEDDRDEAAKPNEKSLSREKMFERFWEAYPKKKAKQEAKRRFLRMKVDDDLFAKIMAGLERACKSQEWAKDNGQYIPHPATWLNGGCWEDEYTPTIQKTQQNRQAGQNSSLDKRRRMTGVGDSYGEDTAV